MRLVECVAVTANYWTLHCADMQETSKNAADTTEGLSLEAQYSKN